MFLIIAIFQCLRTANLVDPMTFLWPLGSYAGFLDRRFLKEIFYKS